jgi:hypothetical protein
VVHLSRKRPALDLRWFGPRVFSNVPFNDIAFGSVWVGLHARVGIVFPLTSADGIGAVLSHVAYGLKAFERAMAIARIFALAGDAR